MKLKKLVGTSTMMLFVLADESHADDHNSLSNEVKSSGWRLLFDGQTTDGWRGYKSDSVPGSWKVEHGSLLSRREKNVSAGDLITMGEFGDFELVLEWKMTKGGNSGVITTLTATVGRLT